jgi:carboxyl-terminal processing protease
MNHSRFLFPSIFLSMLIACTGTPRATGALPSAGNAKKFSYQTTMQLKDWAAVWSSVNDSFIFRDFKGVDWASLREPVARKIEAGLDDASFTTLMDETLALLKDTHTFYLSPEEFRSEASVKAGTGLVGLGFFLSRGDGDYALVGTAVPGGPADLAGIASHDRILAVDGKTALGPDGEPDFRHIKGPEGTSVRLLVASPGGSPRELVIARQAVMLDGGIVMGRILDPALCSGRRIGYILLASMSVPATAELLRAEFLRQSEQAPLDALVLDLRADGDGYYADSCAGLFMEGQMGIDSRIDQALPVFARGEAAGNSRTLPLVVLVHGATNSAGEWLAAALQNSGRAPLIGGRTEGNVGNQNKVRLPGGGLVMVANSRFLPPDGSDPGWLGGGLVPDYSVPGSGWDEFSGSDDPGLAKAVQLLVSK